MNMLFEFLQQNWLIFLIALIILLVVINVVKTMVKWALVIVIVAAVAVYSGISWNDINQVVTTVKDETVQKLQDQALQAMIDEAKNATYEVQADGSFIIKTDNIELKGTEGSSKVEVSFKGVSLGKWEINDTIKTFMDTAKQR